MQILQMFQALANDRRQQILAWLKDPEAHFPAQVDGDLVKDGVCACSIADKLGISRPTLQRTHASPVIGWSRTGKAHKKVDVLQAKRGRDQKIQESRNVANLSRQNEHSTQLSKRSRPFSDSAMMG